MGLRTIEPASLKQIFESNAEWAREYFGRGTASWDDPRRADLQSADLHGMDLRGLDLRGASLNRASLDGASLNRASLDGASLNGASLNRASLDGASLNRASLNGASLNGASLNGASLDGASLNRASLNGASLNGASLNGASLPFEIPIVVDLDKKIHEAITTGGGTLNMSEWHTCETTHCRAGWAITLAGPEGHMMEQILGPQAAGGLIYAASRPDKPIPDFHASNASALASIRHDAGIEHTEEAPA
jgi:hypothetical protein